MLACAIDQVSHAGILLGPWADAQLIRWSLLATWLQRLTPACMLLVWGEGGDERERESERERERA